MAEIRSSFLFFFFLITRLSNLIMSLCWMKGLDCFQGKEDLRNSEQVYEGAVDQALSAFRRLLLWKNSCVADNRPLGLGFDVFFWVLLESDPTSIFFPSNCLHLHSFQRKDP